LRATEPVEEFQANQILARLELVSGFYGGD
jgi:hypothetical protein